MISARSLSAMFRSGDLPFRPRRIAQYWVVKTVKHDPLRCVGVYRDLMQNGGTNHAADLFLTMLENSVKRPAFFDFHMLREPRPPARQLPG